VGPDTKCGSEGQGGEECKSECCAAQKEYCLAVCVCALNLLEPNGCMMSCLADRGCDYEPTCDELKPFPAGLDNKCGSEGQGQGGAECKPECCAAQKEYCENLVLCDDACKAKCDHRDC